MSLLATISVILGAIIIMAIVIYVFEKDTMEAVKMIDAEYESMHRCYNGRFENKV